MNEQEACKLMMKNIEAAVALCETAKEQNILKLVLEQMFFIDCASQPMSDFDENGKPEVK